MSTFNEMELRDRALRSFWVFCNEVMGMNLEEQPHREMCDYMEDSLQPNKLMLVPRDCLKTTICSSLYPLWMVLRAFFLSNNPCYRVLIDSSTVRLSKFVIKNIASWLKNHQMLIATFGMLYSKSGDNAEGLSLTFRMNAATGVKEPNFMSSGIGAEKTGLHADLIIMDDVVTKDNVRSVAMREKTWEHYRMMQAILESDDSGQHTRQVVVGTRYSDDDLYGRMIIQDKERIAEKKAPVYAPMIRAAVDEEGILFYPKKLTKDVLASRRSVMGSLFWCTPAETPITMSDMTEKAISDVKPGDRVLGLSVGPRTKKDSRSSGAQRCKLVPSTVKSVDKFLGEVVEFTLDSGRIVRCTPNHKWFTGRYATDKELGRKTYAPATIGTALHLVAPPVRMLSTEDAVDWAWLGGFFDGEGTAKSSGLSIAQSPTANALVCERLELVLSNLELEYNTYEYDAHRTSNGSRLRMYNVRNRRQLSFDLIRYGHVGKKQQLVDWIYKHGSMPIVGEERVISAVSLGEMPVYSLETETGNYVAWGYASSNSQYMNDPNKEGAPLKKEQLKWHSIADFPKQLKWIRLTVDPAYKEEEKSHGDYSALVVAGWDRWNALWILDVVMRKDLTPGTFIDQVFFLAKKWQIESAIIENAHQEAMDILFRREMKDRQVSFPIFWVKPSRTRGKEMRWLDIQSYAERFAIKIADEIPADTKVEIMDEWERAPFSRFDDFLDALQFQTIYLPIDLHSSESLEPALRGERDLDDIREMARAGSTTPYFGTLADRFPFLNKPDKVERAIWEKNPFSEQMNSTFGD